MKKVTFPIMLLSLLLTSTSCFAEHGQQSYGSQVGHKALNGFTNMTTAILEIPKNIINTTNDSNIILGSVGGLAKGIVNTAGRMLTGLTDFVTSPLPTKPIVQPEYIWDDFDLDTTYGENFRLQDHPNN